MRKDLDLPPILAVVGEFNSGKSTLINRLIGGDVLRTGIDPTTARPTSVQHGQRPPGRSTGPRGLVFHPSPLLQKLRLLDTPGFQEWGRDDEATLQEVMRSADVLLWCTRAEQAWKRTEQQQWCKLPEEVRKTGILVITCADCLNSLDDPQLVLKRVRREAGSDFYRVLLASRDGELAELTDVVRDLANGRAQGLRIAAAERKALVLVEDVEKEWEARLDVLRGLAARLDDVDRAVTSALAACAKSQARADDSAEALVGKFEARARQQFRRWNGSGVAPPGLGKLREEALRGMDEQLSEPLDRALDELDATCERAWRLIVSARGTDRPSQGGGHSPVDRHFHLRAEAAYQQTVSERSASSRREASKAELRNPRGQAKDRIASTFTARSSRNVECNPRGQAEAWIAPFKDARRRLVEWAAAHLGGWKQRLNSRLLSAGKDLDRKRAAVEERRRAVHAVRCALEPASRSQPVAFDAGAGRQMPH